MWKVDILFEDKNYNGVVVLKSHLESWYSYMKHDLHMR